MTSVKHFPDWYKLNGRPYCGQTGTSVIAKKSREVTCLRCRRQVLAMRKMYRTYYRSLDTQNQRNEVGRS